MPVVPLQQGQSVLPSTSAGTPYMQINAQPDDFGAQVGAAEQRVGQGAQQLGGTVMDIATQNQLLANKVAVQAAFNQHQDATTKLLYGDPNDPSKPGFLALQGQAAMNAYPAVAQALEDSRKAQMAALPNARAQLEFDETARRYNTFALTQAGSHYARETDRNAQLTFKEGIDVKANDVAHNYTDDAHFQATLADAQQAADLRTLSQGYTVDSVTGQANRLQATQTLYRARAVAIGTNDPVAGMAFVTANENKFDAITYHSLTSEFKVAADRAAVAGGINSVMGGPLPTPPPPGASVNPDALKAVIRAQEGPGTSIQGAVEGLMPGTFAQYAKPGESIDNPADRVAVHGRIIDDLLSKSGGDWQRVAVGYFSGPGNIAPPGSPTPWKQDRADANGKTVSSYVADIGRRLGAAAGPTPPPRPYVIGDSIGEGIRTAGAFQGQTQVGAAPDAVLRTIQATPDANVKGQNVVLSTGVSNNPTAIGLVTQQVQALQAKGAASVTLVGVGNRADMAGVNDQLSVIAQQTGARFSGPLDPTALAPDGIHPSNYQALAATTTAPPPVPSGPQTPNHNPDAYIAEQQKMDEARAKAAQLFPQRPDLQKLMVDGVWQSIQQANVLQAKYQAERQKALADAQQAAGNAAMDAIIKDPTKFDPQSLVGTTLTFEQKAHLLSIAQQELTRTAQGQDSRTYGPKFEELFQAVHSPDPTTRITDPNQIWAHGANGDLNAHGVQALIKELTDMRGPAGESEGAMKKAVLDAAHVMISGHIPGMMNGRDPIGEQKYAQFLVQALTTYAQGRASGMSAQQLLDEKGPIMQLVPKFTRTLAQRNADMMSAMGLGVSAAPATPAPAPSAPDLTTAAGIAAAYKAGHFGDGPLAWDRANAELLKRGLLQRPAVGPQVPVQ